MDNTEKEKFYDETIAPQLLHIAKLCVQSGISFVAGVEWEPGEIGRTAALGANAGEGIRRANLALQVDRPHRVRSDLGEKIALDRVGHFVLY